ncbi:MAG: sortase-like acyltransferase [Acidimicrobiaceae bacterium]|nr:sortase-like acyltransferase [Acidimicrobiaceae bacterium]
MSGSRSRPGGTGSVGPMQIRLARPDDGEALRVIYNREVLNSTVTFDLVARTSEEQEMWMAEHSGVYPIVVADDGGQAVGFASLSPFRPRPAYATTVEDSVYVADSHRGQGVGKALLLEVVELAGAHGFHSVIGRVVGHHEASIGLHRACGFELVGVEKEVGRKFGHWLDVAVMQLLL